MQDDTCPLSIRCRNPLMNFD